MALTHAAIDIQARLPRGVCRIVDDYRREGISHVLELLMCDRFPIDKLELKDILSVLLQQYVDHEEGAMDSLPADLLTGKKRKRSASSATGAFSVRDQRLRRTLTIAQMLSGWLPNALVSRCNSGDGYVFAMLVNGRGRPDPSFWDECRGRQLPTLYYNSVLRCIKAGWSDRTIQPFMIPLTMNPKGQVTFRNAEGCRDALVMRDPGLCCYDMVSRNWDVDPGGFKVHSPVRKDNTPRGRFLPPNPPGKTLLRTVLPIS